MWKVHIISTFFFWECCNPVNIRLLSNSLNSPFNVLTVWQFLSLTHYPNVASFIFLFQEVSISSTAHYKGWHQMFRESFYPEPVSDSETRLPSSKAEITWQLGRMPLNVAIQWIWKMEIFRTLSFIGSPYLLEQENEWCYIDSVLS